MGLDPRLDQLELINWSPVFSGGPAFPPGETPVTKAYYEDGITPAELLPEIQNVKTRFGKVPEGLDRLIIMHLGRIQLLDTLAQASIQARDFTEFDRYYSAMTHKAKIVPAGHGYRRDRQTDFIDHYPEAFRRINIEPGMVRIIAGYALQHPDDADKIAKLHVRRMNNLERYNYVRSDLPTTRLLVELVENRMGPNSEALQPLAQALRLQLDLKSSQKTENSKKDGRIEGKAIKQAITNLDIEDESTIMEGEKAAVEATEAESSDRLQAYGMDIVSKTLQEAADKGYKNAKIINNLLLKYRKITGSQHSYPDDFIKAANDITMAMKKQRPDSLLGKAKRLEPYDNNDLAKAIDRIMYAAFATGNETPERYQRISNMASVLAAAGGNRITVNHEDRGQLTHTDLAIRYWTLDKSTRQSIMDKLEQGIDETLVYSSLANGTEISAK